MAAREKRSVSGVVFSPLFSQKKKLIADTDLINESNVILLQNAGSLRVDCRHGTYIHIYCIEELSRWILFG